jgi:hypothetical protein
LRHNHDRQRWVSQKRLTDSGRQIQHVGSALGAEVFQQHLEIAGGIVFQVRMVAAQTVLANLAGFGVEVGN